MTKYKMVLDLSTTDKVQSDEYRGTVEAESKEEALLKFMERKVGANPGSYALEVVPETKLEKLSRGLVLTVEAEEFADFAASLPFYFAIKVTRLLSAYLVEKV